MEMPEEAAEPRGLVECVCLGHVPRTLIATGASVAEYRTVYAKDLLLQERRVMAGKSPLMSVESSCKTVGCMEQTSIAAKNSLRVAVSHHQDGHLGVRWSGRIVAVAADARAVGDRQTDRSGPWPAARLHGRRDNALLQVT